MKPRRDDMKPFANDIDGQQARRYDTRAFAPAHT